MLLLHIISLLLTALDILTITGAGVLLYLLFMTDGELPEYVQRFINTIHLDALLLTADYRLVLGGVILGCALLLPFIDIMRRKTRTSLKYDKYGRLKALDAYEHMSVKEQKELDKQRALRLQQILPSTMLHEMTKRGSKNPEKDLDTLVGLEDVKEKVAEMEVRMQRDRKRKNVSKHMVFFGPPGTGKTTVVSVMTAYLKRYGYIEENRYIQVNGTFFTGPDASEKLEAVVQRSFGGVLFIDEAYAMLQGGQEAVSMLISQMEDNRDKFVLIMAGYEDDMKYLLQSNSGFLSRIQEFVFFPNYSEEELLDIFLAMAKREGYTVDEGGKIRFRECITKAMQDYSFGNARTCRNMLDKAISRHLINMKHDRSLRRNVLSVQDIVYERNPLAER